MHQGENFAVQSLQHNAYPGLTQKVSWAEKTSLSSSPLCSVVHVLGKNATPTLDGEGEGQLDPSFETTLDMRYAASYERRNSLPAQKLQK